MTVENNINVEESTGDSSEATSEATSEVTSEQITNVGEVNSESKTISVDLFGTAVELPIDKAKEIIKGRDSRSKAFNEIANKVKNYETQLEDNKRQLQAIEAAKNGLEKEAEALFNQKLEEKVNMYRQKIVDGELKSVLLSEESFLQEGLEDAINLIKLNNNFDLDDSNNITSSGKKVNEIVKEFLDAKPVFRKASKEASSLKNGRPAPVKPAKEKASLANGLKNFLDK